ncbi:MAG: succinate dehydrogenase, hydrophobic membrane anchor protein [Maricaulaceae bacterium]|jgi:succinate dehydrogenase / fumarate reductase membrane anchor subunit
MSSQFQTPRKTTVGLGSAKSGTGHFIQQRVTAIALVALVAWFAVAAATAIGSGYDGARDFISNPVAAVLLLLFVSTAFYHMRIGMQVVIEDYIEGHGARIALLILNTFVAAALWVAAAFSILTIAL